MVNLSKLTTITTDGLKLIKKEPGLVEGLVYASSNRRTVGRLVYTTHIPCNGLEEPKSDEDIGVCVEVWLKRGKGRVVGIGHEPNELSLEAVKRALGKAKRDAVSDPDFQGFLKPDTRTQQLTTASFHDETLIRMNPAEEAQFLSKTSWETIQGALDGLESYTKTHKRSLNDLAFILNGDHFIIREQMALATTNGIVDADESSIVLSFLTALLERDQAKGSAWGSRLSVTDGFSGFDVGRRAALAAINAIGGVRVESGQYDVIFGPQAVTELFGNLLLPNLTLGLVDFGASIFTGRYGQQIASELLTLSDDATIPAGAGSKRITCEGCPTGKTLLIEKGRLVGYLSDSRTTNKVLKRSHDASKKLGIDPHEIRHALAPRNGFRFSEGGGRVASSPIGIHATNLVIESHRPDSEGQLLEKVRNGLYIGRLWYTYPVGGMSSGIISGTAIADCYMIRDGKLAGPILPNTLRLEDNLKEMVKHISGIGDNQVQTVLWASDEITHAPWVAIEGVRFLSIGNSQ